MEHVIISKPIPSTQFAFATFFMLGVAISTYGIMAWWNNGASWYHYVALLLFLPTSLFLLFKIVLGLKIIQVNNDTLKVHYLLFPRKRKYSVEHIEYWKEEVIKTSKNESYRELEVRFKDSLRIRMAFKEYTNYEKLLAYFSKKIPGKKRN